MVSAELKTSLRTTGDRHPGTTLEPTGTGVMMVPTGTPVGLWMLDVGLSLD